MTKRDIEYSALMEEFKCLKAEIAANLAASRQAINLTLVAFGLVAGGAKALTDTGSYWLLLLGPPVFFALTLTQLRYTYLAIEMGSYIDRKIACRIRELAGSKQVMGWESNPSELFTGPRWLPIRGATLALPLLGAMICLALFCGVHFRSGHSMSPWPLDPLSFLGYVEIAFVVGAAVYCFAAGNALEGARTRQRGSTRDDEAPRSTPPDDQPGQSGDSVDT